MALPGMELKSPMSSAQEGCPASRCMARITSSVVLTCAVCTVETQGLMTRLQELQGGRIFPLRGHEPRWLHRGVRVSGDRAVQLAGQGVVYTLNGQCASAHQALHSATVTECRHTFMSPRLGLNSRWVLPMSSAGGPSLLCCALPVPHCHSCCGSACCSRSTWYSGE